jgi:hypothetical protein
MKKKTTIGAVPPKPPKNTTGATNRTSGYLNPNAAGNKKVAPKKSTIKITGSAKAAPVEVKKTFKPGSMITSSKNVIVTPAKKASTSYSPKPMAGNDKKAAGFRGAITQYQIMMKKKNTAAAIAKAKKK